jgi:hypothetical protein
MSYICAEAAMFMEPNETRNGEAKFHTFEDQEVCQLARAFRKSMYSVSRKLPAFQEFELASQLRRGTVSLTHNRAEGHGRYPSADHARNHPTI